MIALGLLVVLAPPVRMDFRGLTDEVLKPGVAITFEAVPHKQTRDELRATTITIGAREFDLR